MQTNLMNRVAVFVDGSDFYFGLKRNNCVNRVDYHQFATTLTGEDRKLVRTFYYNAVYDQHQFPDKAKVQRPFYDALERTPYLVLRLGKLIPTATGDTVVRGVEPMMTADMVHYAHLNHYDTAIVVTENPEFAIALRTVKETGKHVELALFNDVKPADLVRAADRILCLDDLLNVNGKKVFPQSAPPTAPPTAPQTAPVEDYDVQQPKSNASHLPFLNSHKK